MSMKTPTKQEWLDALRSREYKQTTGAYRQDGCFCALGVYLDLVVKKNGGRWTRSNTTNVEFEGKSAVAADWFVDSEATAEMYRQVGDDVVDMNDHGHASFNEIADYIEENWNE